MTPTASRLIAFPGAPAAAQPIDDPRALAAFLEDASIEITPRVALKLPEAASALRPGTRVYVAHIDGSSDADQRAAVGRVAAAGLRPVPHVPARSFASAAQLTDQLAAYADLGATEALTLAGGAAAQRGPFDSSMALLETGLFDRFGFRRLDVAGHPEGNRDIDADGGDAAAMAALRWKQAFRARTDAEMAVVTQFAFDPAPIFAWADRLRAEGIDLPIRLGVAGPTKLQALVKYAIACGVGPSLKVLQRRAMDMTKLLTPFEPWDVLTPAARRAAADPDSPIQGAHLFPLGGFAKAAEWLAARIDEGAEKTQVQR